MLGLASSLVILVTAATAVTALGAQTASSASALDLTGTWLRLERESEEPLEKYADQLGGALGGSVGWQPGSRSSGPVGPSGGPTSSPGARGRNPAGPPAGFGVPRQELEEMMRGLEVLKIDLENDDQLLMRDGNRQDRLLFLDGRTLSDGLGSETTARLDDDALVVDTRSERRERTEVFTVEQDASGEVRLVLLTELRGGRAPEIEFRTVYERVAGGGVLVGAVGERAGQEGELRGAPPSERASLLPPVSRDRDAASSDSQADQRRASADAPPRQPLRPSGGDSSRRAATIRILPPEATIGQLLSGRVTVQTLNIDPDIQTVEFYLDGERVERRVLPPWEANLRLDDPPREQLIEVKAYGRGDREVGSDRLVVNRLDPRFGVRLTEVSGDPTYGSLEVAARVSVPRDALLQGLDVYWNQELLDTLPSEVEDGSKRGSLSVEEFSAQLPVRADLTRRPGQDFVRVVARLNDGRELEDVRLFDDPSSGLSETLDVQLVRLQVLVVDRRGVPVTDLEPSDFEVVERERRRGAGEKLTVDRVIPSRDVALTLGMAIDSSGSMLPVWDRTRELTGAFLEQTLRPRDGGFLVDFDQRLRLLQPLTSDREALSRALERLEPQGGTALYDSILFSLLQFGDAKGRKALVVFTDGFDSDSRADPERAIDFGRRLGVPVYVIALAGRSPSMVRGRRSGADLALIEATARSALRLITEPTGGRLFQVASLDQVERVYDQIEEELRNQLIVTYYTERDPLSPLQPELRVLRKGLEVRSAVPIDLVEDDLSTPVGR